MIHQSAVEKEEEEEEEEKEEEEKEEGRGVEKASSVWVLRGPRRGCA